MHTDGDLTGGKPGLGHLIAELRASDFSIDTKKLRLILSYGDQLVAELEGLLQEALDRGASLNFDSPQAPADRFAAVHALYLLSQLRSEKSLDIVLDFIAQKQTIVDYWLHDLVQDDIWEVIFHLGQNRLGKLEEFILDQRHNLFSRLSVGTTLVQLALHFDSKRPLIVATFKKFLNLENEEPDFMGLMISELLDLREQELRRDIIEALQKHEVWSGIITAKQVNQSLQKQNVRRLRPLGIFERYSCFSEIRISATSRGLRSLS